MASHRATSLLKQGIQAAQAGNPQAAKGFFVQALKLDPQNETGWKWMVQVVETDREREFCLQKLVDINPNNAKARAALAKLQEKTAPPPPPPPPPQPPAASPDIPSTGELSFDFEESWPDTDQETPADDLWGGAEELDWLDENLTPAGESAGLDWPEPEEPPASAAAPASGNLGLEWPEDAADDWGSQAPAQPAEDGWGAAAEAGTWDDWDTPGLDGLGGLDGLDGLDEAGTATADDGLDALRAEAEEEAPKKKGRRGRKKAPKAKAPKQPAGRGRRILRLVLVLLILVVVAAGAIVLVPRFLGGGEPEVAGTLYETEDFSITYPDAWTLPPDGEDLLFPGALVTLTRGDIDPAAETPPESFAVFAIMKESTGSDLNLDELVTSMTDQFEGAELIEQGEISIDGQPGIAASFSLNDFMGLSAYLYVAGTSVGDESFLVTMVGTETGDLSAAEQMVDSIVWAAAEAATAPTETLTAAPTEAATQEDETTEEATEASTEEAIEATATEQDGEQATPTVEVLPPPDVEPAQVVDATMLPNAVAEVSGVPYTGERFSLIYPGDWDVVSDNPESLVLSLGPVEMEPLPEAFSWIVISLAPAGENPPDVFVDLLRPVIATQLEAWDTEGTVNLDTFETVDLGTLSIDGQAGAYNHLTAERAIAVGDEDNEDNEGGEDGDEGESRPVHIYAATTVLPGDEAFSLVLYSTDEEAITTAEAIVASVRFRIVEATATPEPTETPTPEPEADDSLGPPAPPPPDDPG